jgi:hypothetical protein
MTRPVAEIGRLDADTRQRAGGLTRLLQRDRGRAEAGAGERRQLARDAHDGETIGPVRGDLDLEHVVVEAERGDEVGAGPRAVQQQDPPLVLLAESQLALRAEHALGLDAVNLRGGDPATARQDRPGGREGGAGAHLRVRRAAHHGMALAARAHAAQDEAVAVAHAELALDGLDLADHDALAVGRQRRHRRDLDAGVDQAIGRLLGRQPELDELLDPPVENLHVTRTVSGSAGRSRRTGGGRRSRT